MLLEHAESLAITLMIKHNIYQRGWKFKFDNAKKRFGVCRHRSKIISLSKHLVSLNEVNQVQDTILHEIAHALTPGHGHDWIWKQKAKEIGCKPIRCYSNEVATPKSKYEAVCVGCNHTHKRHRKAKRSTSCGYCSGGKYNPTFKLEFVQTNN